MSPQRIKAMIEHQVKACEAFLHRTSPDLAIKLPIADFVTRVFTLHRRLIERWNGAWYYHTKPVLVEDTSYSFKVATQCWNSFIRRTAHIVEGWRLSFQIANNWEATIGYSLALSSKVFERKYLSPFGDIIEISTQRQYLLRLGYKRNSEGRQLGDPIVAPIRVGQRIGPVAIRALRNAGVPKELLREWENLFQNLGELAWVGKKVPIACTMSCAPVSFLRLGHYGESSCYKNGGGADYSKLWLAADCPDSFVLLFHRGKESIAVKRTLPIKVSGRGWGIGALERGAFVSNFYLLSKELVALAVKRAIGDALGVRNPEWVEAPLGSIADTFANYSSLYLNDDRQLITEAQSQAKLKMLQYYLKQVIRHASKYGLYSFHGGGPQDMMEYSRNRPSGYSLKRISYEIPILWPYKDATTQRLTADAVNRLGSRLINMG